MSKPVTLNAQGTSQELFNIGDREPISFVNNGGRAMVANYGGIVAPFVSQKEAALSAINYALSAVPTQTLTTTGAGDLAAKIITLQDGDILEIQTDGTYNPITIPANKQLFIRARFGDSPIITGSRCIRLQNGAANVVISGLRIEETNITGGNVNYTGGGITFSSEFSIVKNIIFHNVHFKNDAITTQSMVLLSYHWTNALTTYPTEVQSSRNIVFLGCTFERASSSSTNADILIRGCKEVLISDCTFRNEYGSGVALYAATAQIEGSEFRNTPGHAIRLGAVGTATWTPYLTVNNNHLENIQYGVGIYAGRANIIDNFFYIVGNTGVLVDTGSKAQVIKNAFLTGQNGVRVSNGAEGFLRHNTHYDMSYPFTLLNGKNYDWTNTGFVDQDARLRTRTSPLLSKLVPGQNGTSGVVLWDSARQVTVRYNGTAWVEV